MRRDPSEARSHGRTRVRSIYKLFKAAKGIATRSKDATRGYWEQRASQHSFLTPTVLVSVVSSCTLTKHYEYCAFCQTRLNKALGVQSATSPQDLRDPEAQVLGLFRHQIRDHSLGLREERQLK